MAFTPVPISATCAVTPACNLVSNGWNSMTEFGNDSYAYTLSYVDALIGSINPAQIEVPTADLTLNFPSTTLGAPAIPSTPPVPTDLDITVPPTPPAPTLNAISQIDVPDTPQFLAQYPTINLPAAPSAITDEAPSGAPTFTTPTVPVAPDTVIPEAPTLRSLNIPDAPTLDIPEFTAIAPDPVVGVFNPSIDFTEALYDSTLLQQVQSVLLTTLQNGDGGLPEDIVDQIWNRERERELKEYNRAAATALDDFAARGFDMPPGALQSRLRVAERENITAAITMGREKTIEQVQRAYEHLKFVIQSTIGLEGQLMNYTNNMYQRLLQVQTALLDAGVAVYNAKVNAYNAEVQAYRVYADVFKTQVDAELTKIEVFRAEIEAQKAIGELNVQDLEAYKIAVDAVQTISEVYRTEMQAAQIEAEVQRVSIEAFRAEVEAYTAKVQAKTAEYEGYAQQINGELAKTRVYESAASAYGSEVQGYRALVDAESARVRADVDVNKALVDEYQGKVSAFRALVEAESTKIGSKVQAFGAEIDAFRAAISGEVAKTEAERANLTAQVSVAASEADLRLKQAEANISRAQTLLGLYNEALKSGATVSAQITASAMDAINLSAGISGSDQTNYNYSL